VQHQFRVILDEHPGDDDAILDVADRLGEAGCLDASVGGHVDGTEVDFHREADSLERAIKSAVTAIEGAGYRVLRVELERSSIALGS
jgi:hypothetical protein